jgi:hypothetical protein
LCLAGDDKRILALKPADSREHNRFDSTIPANGS